LVERLPVDADRLEAHLGDLTVRRKGGDTLLAQELDTVRQGGVGVGGVGAVGLRATGAFAPHAGGAEQREEQPGTQARQPWRTKGARPTKGTMVEGRHGGRDANVSGVLIPARLILRRPRAERSVRET